MDWSNNKGSDRATTNMLPIHVHICLQDTAAGVRTIVIKYEILNISDRVATSCKWATTSCKRAIRQPGNLEMKSWKRLMGLLRVLYFGLYPFRLSFILKLDLDFVKSWVTTIGSHCKFPTLYLNRDLPFHSSNVYCFSNLISY